MNYLALIVSLIGICTWVKQWAGPDDLNYTYSEYKE